MSLPDSLKILCCRVHQFGQDVIDIELYPVDLLPVGKRMNADTVIINKDLGLTLTVLRLEWIPDNHAVVILRAQENLPDRDRLHVIGIHHVIREQFVVHPGLNHNPGLGLGDTLALGYPCGLLGYVLRPLLCDLAFNRPLGHGHVHLVAVDVLWLGNKIEIYYFAGDELRKYDLLFESLSTNTTGSKIKPLGAEHRHIKDRPLKRDACCSDEDIAHLLFPG